LRVLNKPIFDAPGMVSKEQRRAAINASLGKYRVGDDFFAFGSTYFDGGPMSAAYRRYEYDGRYRSSVKSLINEFSLKQHYKIFEFGCAKGFILAEFWALGFHEITGVDISKYAIDNAHDSVRSRLHCAGLDFLRSGNELFNFIFSKEVLPHLSEDEIGEFFLELPKIASDRCSIYLEIQVAETEMQRDLIAQFDPTHRSLWPSSRWVEILERSPVSEKITVYFKELC
jgi:cyclopropane fatty-acyl-phospholipid synthase-like methyltransferase